MEKNIRIGDLGITKTGELGVAILCEDGFKFLSLNGELTDIVEIRSSMVGGILTKASWESGDLIWSANNKFKTFIGVSNAANKLELNHCLTKFDEYILYDYELPLATNNERLALADRHIIVPPKTFILDHIIGRGLYEQILVRQKVNKTSEIFIGGKFASVRKLYKLELADNLKTAVVSF